MFMPSTFSAFCPSSQPNFYAFLGAFVKLRKATISFVMSVCLSLRLSAWENSAPTGRIFMKLYIWVYFQNLSRKIQDSLQSDQNTLYFPWRLIYIFDHYWFGSF
jgi:hypothetical protein